MAGQDVLVDGHNRYEICSEHNVAFEVEERPFASRDAVADWIDKNQAARRNCTPEQYRIITGRIYNRRKKSQGGDRKSSDQIEHLNGDRTADEVAVELGLSRATVKRNAQRAELHDELLASGDIEAAEAARTSNATIVDNPARYAIEC